MCFRVNLLVEERGQDFLSGRIATVVATTVACTRPMCASVVATGAAAAAGGAAMY